MAMQVILLNQERAIGLGRRNRDLPAIFIPATMRQGVNLATAGALVAPFAYPGLEPACPPAQP